MRGKLISLFSVFIVLIFWQLGSSQINELFLPSPLKILETFKVMLTTNILIESLISSFVRISIATILSAMLSIFIGLLVVNYSLVKSIVLPITNTSRFIPITAFYPLLIMWLGIDEKMKIAFLFIATFLYFLPATISTFNDTDQRLIDTGLTMGMNRLQLMWHIILPYCTPTILKMFLTMYGIGWTYVIVAETVNTNNGLGHIMHIASARGRTDMVFVAIITIMVFNFLFDYFGNAIINSVFKWKNEITMGGE